MTQWLLLVYKVPNEPSARRVYVWRKLKRLAALALQDAIWVLPATSHTREQLEWLAAEILEMGGEAFLWEASQVLAQPEAHLIQQFIDQVEAGYQEILAALAQAEADLAALSKRYQQLKSQDYFNAPLGQAVRDALLRARGEDV